MKADIQAEIDALPTSRPARPVHDFAVKICEHHQITMAELRGQGRSLYLQRPRKAFVKGCIEDLGCTARQVARFLNREDSTIRTMIIRMRRKR